MKLYDMKVFQRCCPFQKELHSEMVATVKKGSTEWYERMRSISQSQTATDDDCVSSLTDLANRCNTDMQKAIQYYNSTFESITHVSYFQVAYKQMEKLLGDDLNRELEKVSFVVPDVTESTSPQVSAQQMGTNLFELYLSLQEFCRER